jgi:beta-glucanase (GH16 family)
MIRRMWAGAAGAVAALLLGGCAAAPSGPVWANVWSGSFSGPAGQGVNTSTWVYDTDHGAALGTGEVEQLTTSPANVHLDGHGHLELVPLRDTTGGWTSGRIETKNSFTAPAGGEMQVTATIRQPNPAVAAGYWPAFWMLARGREPGLGEIDIMEDVNSGTQTAGTLHCGDLARKNPDGTAGPCHEPDGLSNGLLPCPACQTGYHTYSVIIDRRHAGREQVRWYLDGRETFSVSETQVGAAAWTAAVDHSFRIILDLAIGGSYPDATCRCHSPTSQTTSGAAMSIASVAVWDLKR